MGGRKNWGSCCSIQSPISIIQNSNRLSNKKIIYSNSEAGERNFRFFQFKYYLIKYKCSTIFSVPLRNIAHIATEIAVVTGPRREQKFCLPDKTTRFTISLLIRTQFTSFIAFHDGKVNTFYSFTFSRIYWFCIL